MGGQIVDASVIQARRPRLTRSEKATIKGGGVPSGWSKAKRAQMDTEGRWTLKRGRKRSAEPSAPHARTRSELVIPVFGYKNHLGIDRRYGFVRCFAVTDAASHDSRQLGKLLDPDNTASGVWADVPPTVRRRPRRCWRGAGWCRTSSGQSPAAGRCRRTWSAATPAGRGCGSRSSTCSPPRSAASAWSSARATPGSGSPTWSPT
jgi:hypothetical protein